MDISELIDGVIAREGGFSDHPADRGGPTRWGITQAVARAQGYGGPMALLPRETAARYYRILYWEQPGLAALAEIAPNVAGELFDTAVNMGPGVAVGFLQRALNALNREGSDYPDLTMDRKLGPVTMKAVAALIKRRGKTGERALLKAVDALQGAHYIALAEARPANEAFVLGWLTNRVG